MVIIFTRLSNSFGLWVSDSVKSTRFGKSAPELSTRTCFRFSLHFSNCFAPPVQRGCPPTRARTPPSSIVVAPAVPCWRPPATAPRSLLPCSNNLRSNMQAQLQEPPTTRTPHAPQAQQQTEAGASQERGERAMCLSRSGGMSEMRSRPLPRTHLTRTQRTTFLVFLLFCASSFTSSGWPHTPHTRACTWHPPTHTDTHTHTSWKVAGLMTKVKHQHKQLRKGGFGARQ